MMCPFCSNEDTKVTDSRSIENGSVIKRRRFCGNCSKRFTTYEKMDAVPLIVVKSDSRREHFDRNKLLKGLIMACNKRPIAIDQLEQLAKELENEIYLNNKREITSAEIGEFVMDRLKKIDPIAYVRFASVYREFEDVTSFIEEVGKVLKD